MVHKEIGGFFELECRGGGTWHKGVLLNSARNALRYIIRSLGIKKVSALINSVSTEFL